jgi:hypothetical protein
MSLALIRALAGDRRGSGLLLRLLPQHRVHGAHRLLERLLVLLARPVPLLPLPVGERVWGRQKGRLSDRWATGGC